LPLTQGFCRLGTKNSDVRSNRQLCAAGLK
jgi:hypothetical protein